MRLMLFFDLPTLTPQNRKNYRQFRKILIREGFLMLQESVYSKVILNQKAAEFLENRVQQVCPSDGLVQTIIITENQFTKMKYLVGDKPTALANSSDRILII